MSDKPYPPRVFVGPRFRQVPPPPGPRATLVSPSGGTRMNFVLGGQARKGGSLDQEVGCGQASSLTSRVQHEREAVGTRRGRGPPG